MKQPLAPGLAYFFRGSAVIPLNEAVVLSMEQRTPPIAVKPSGSTTPYGLIDYTAAAAGRSVAGEVIVWFVRFSPAWLTPPQTNICLGQQLKS